MTSGKTRFLAVLTVRNEGAFLLEWLAHHRAVGVTDFLIFSNDCQDGTDLMLDRLQDLGGVTHLRNDGPYDNRGIQFTALKRAETQDIVRQADWILTLDIDEFINIHTGDRTLPALLTALPDATAITLTWRLFGNAGIVEYSDQPVTETFLQAAPELLIWPWRAAMFKTLYRNDGTYRKLGIHRPRAPDPERIAQARWFDGQGRALPPAFRTSRIFSNHGQLNYGLVQLNHYPLGAMESYMLKADRGRANRACDPMAMDYWVERNFNIERDSSILQMGQAMHGELDRLRADATLAALHAAAVDWRQQRFLTLMQSDAQRSLFARLLLTPPSQPMPQSQARRIVRFALDAQRETSRNGNTKD